MFSKLIADFVHDREVRDQFESNPIAVMDQYGISPADRTLLRGGFSPSLVARIAEDLAQGLSSAREADSDQWSIKEVRDVATAH